MSEWDKKYCNMEVQAYIKIEKKGMGEFQFGLVTASLNGDFKKTNESIISIDLSKIGKRKTLKV